MSTIGFTAGGIDVSQIVAGLMEVERQPIARLQDRSAMAKLQSDAVGRLRNSFEGLKSMAAALLAPGGFAKFSSSVSAPSIVSVSTTSSALPGSISFTVDRLARAHGVRTVGTVASSTSLVTTASSLAVSTTARRIGASSVSADSSVAVGKYTVSVTQATAGAVRSGSSSLAGSTVITASNNTLEIDVDGVTRNVTIAAGTYDATGLAAAVQAGLDAVGAGVGTSLDASGRLVLTSTHEGSAATLQVSGGTALADLRLAVDAVAVTGVDGTVQIGTNPPVTVTSAGTGDTIAVATGSGDLTLTLTGGLRAGDATVAVVSTGDRSLAAVASAINSANVGASAAAVKLSDGAWLLQLNAASTGSANAIAIDPNGLDLAGGFVQTSAAQDARITIGSGPGAYSVSASGNTFTNVLPGVSFTALAESTLPVTVNVARNDSATADAVEALIGNISKVLAEINLQVKYDTVAKKSSPLSGDATIRGLPAVLRSALTSLVPGGSVTLAGSVGISTQRDGTLKFDRSAFLAALQADPNGVERLFARGGTAAGSATFASATDKTIAGSYAVEVTTAATRAASAEELIGGSPSGQVIGVRIGSVTATYTATPGATAAEIASGLNTAMNAAGLAINAELGPGGGIVLRAVGYGASGSFETDIAGSWTEHLGTDVVGTIDGKPAVGVGNRLSLLDTDTSLARGLAITVAEGVTGTVGPVDYEPGIAARLVSLVTKLTGTGGGLVTSASSFDSKIKSYNEQIARFEDRLILKETQLRRQWSAVQGMLSSLQTQGDWLANQIKGLQSRSD